MNASKNAFAAAALGLAVSACAGRAPQPVELVRATDEIMTCDAIQMEVSANNARIGELGSERGAKVAQNVAAGVAGVFIPVLWFGMDFQNAAGVEERALSQRNQYLAQIALRRCGAAQTPAVAPALAPAASPPPRR